MGYPGGCDVVVNTGGPDIPGRVEARTPQLGVPRGCVCVRLPSGGAQWIEEVHVRVMRLADHQRVAGMRFCDWHRDLWYTLVFCCGHGFAALVRDDLYGAWRTGRSVATTATQIAATHGWPCSPVSAPAYARPYIADLGDDGAGRVGGACEA